MIRFVFTKYKTGVNDKHNFYKECKLTIETLLYKLQPITRFLVPDVPLRDLSEIAFTTKKMTISTKRGIYNSPFVSKIAPVRQIAQVNKVACAISLVRKFQVPIRQNW